MLANDSLFPETTYFKYVITEAADAAFQPPCPAHA
jgi:hypothetical protein